MDSYDCDIEDAALSTMSDVEDAILYLPKILTGRCVVMPNYDNGDGSWTATQQFLDGDQLLLFPHGLNYCRSMNLAEPSRHQSQ